MKTTIMMLLVAAGAFAQITIPDGTKLRVRLEQAISSATADEGQTVELAVTEAINVGDSVVFPEGTRVTGTITMAQAKRRMGRSGKLDFSIDRARAVDGEWVPLRYLLNKKTGESHATRAGVLTAGAAIVFWPAAPFFLLMHGKDTTINKGDTFDVFTDSNHVLQNARPAAPTTATTAGGLAAQPQPAMMPVPSGSGTAQITITSPVAGAEIEIDGGFAGNTPTTVQIPAGSHEIVVKSAAGAPWQRTIKVNAGSTISINALSEQILIAPKR